VLTVVLSFQIYCLGKCGIVERALCGGRHGGFSGLWKAIEVVLLHISLGIDNLDNCG
jgi:hypothetical protein